MICARISKNSLPCSGLVKKSARLSHEATKYTCDTHTGKKGAPNTFHHFCFVNYYKKIKKKELAEEEHCNLCPACAAPKLSRGSRRG